MQSTRDVAVVRDVLDNFSLIKGVVAKVVEVKARLVNLCLDGHITEAEFYKVSSLLTPQSRSPLWERYFIAKHHCAKAHLSEDAGDLIMDGVHYEYKVSCNDDGMMHIVQARLWQNCDYIVQSIQPDRHAITFTLSHAEMEKEMKLLRASVAHGTRTANVNNANVELRATVVIDSADWKRWTDNYLRGEDAWVDLGSL